MTNTLSCQVVFAAYNIVRRSNRGEDKYKMLVRLRNFKKGLQKMITKQYQEGQRTPMIGDRIGKYQVIDKQSNDNTIYLVIYEVDNSHITLPYNQIRDARENAINEVKICLN